MSRSTALRLTSDLSFAFECLVRLYDRHRPQVSAPVYCVVVTWLGSLCIAFNRGPYSCARDSSSCSTIRCAAAAHALFVQRPPPRRGRSRCGGAHSAPAADDCAQADAREIAARLYSRAFDALPTPSVASSASSALGVAQREARVTLLERAG